MVRYTILITDLIISSAVSVAIVKLSANEQRGRAIAASYVLSEFPSDVTEFANTHSGVWCAIEHCY